MYSSIHVFPAITLILNLNLLPLSTLTSTSTSPALDPAGLAALQIPRATRRDFAQPQPFGRLRATPQS